VTVIDPDEDRRSDKPDVVEVGVLGVSPPEPFAVGDEENLVLVETGDATGTFRNVECMPLRGAEPAPGDGTLQVEPGDLVSAVYQDPDNPPEPSSPEEVDASLDTAFVTGGRSEGRFRYRIDPGILPEALSSTPGRLPGEPPRPLAIAVGPQRIPLLFGEDQVVHRAASPGDRGDFLARWEGFVIDEISVPEKSELAGERIATYSVMRIEPTLADLEHLDYLAELFGLEGDWTFSSEDAVRLVALLLEEQLAGAFVTSHSLTWPFAAPVIEEGDRNEDGFAGDDGFRSQWWTSCAGVCPATAIAFRDAAIYLDLVDRNQAESVVVAIIDGGFASPGAYLEREELVEFGGNNPDFGADFSSIEQGDCRSSRCEGTVGRRNRLPCSGTGRCPWHGTQVFSVIGAVANNGFGHMGIAGHGRDLASGADGERGIVRPIFYEQDYGYTSSIARGIEAARRAGADIVNVSSGWPCEPWSDIDVCSPATQAAISVACSVAGFVLGYVAPGILAVVSGIGCQGLTELLAYVGSSRSAMRNAVNRAIEEDVIVVASGPQRVRLPVLGEEGPHRAREVETIPCVLPGVICVGNMHDRVYDPERDEDPGSSTPGPCDDGQDNGMDGDADADDGDCMTIRPHDSNPHGSGIDIWAPGIRIWTTPRPGSEGLPGRRSEDGGREPDFAGTSAAAPFVSGVAALLRAADPTLTPQRVLEILQDTSHMFPQVDDPTRPCESHPLDATRCVGYVNVLGAVQEAVGRTLTCTGLNEGNPHFTRLGEEITASRTPVFDVAVALDAGFPSAGTLLIGAERLGFNNNVTTPGLPDPPMPNHFRILQRGRQGTTPGLHPVGRRVFDASTLEDDILREATTITGLGNTIGSQASVMGDLAIHTFPSDLPGAGSDLDWYRFTVPNLGTPTSPGPASTEMEIELSSDDALRLLLGVAGGGIVADTDSAGGVGRISGLLFFAGRDYLPIVSRGPSRYFHDSCYGASLTLRVTGAGPAPDVFDASGPSNESSATATPLNAWEHHHANQAIFAHGVGSDGRLFLPQRELWEMEIRDLTLDSETDRDFLRIQLPDPASDADGGHANIDPDHEAHPGSFPPEPMPECGTVERRDGEGNLVPVDLAGELIVRVDFTTAHADEPIRSETPGTGPFRGEVLRVACPRTSGIDEVVFSVGDVPGRDVAAAYDVSLTYQIHVNRFTRPADWMLAEREVRGLGSVRGLPCGTRLFPGCEALFVLEHPIDPARLPECEAGGPGCPQFLLFPWPGGTLDLTLRSETALRFELFDETLGERIAEAVPSARLFVSEEVSGLSTTLEQRLLAPDLAPGVYVLVVDGTAARIQVEFEPIEPIEIPIDVKPGNGRNPVNPGSRGTIPVALLARPDFNPLSAVDPLTLSFGPTGMEESFAGCGGSDEDTDGDSLADLVCHFDTPRAGFACGDEQAVLLGRTVDGLPIAGREAVRTVGCRAP
jgi:subtilisin family serine protease